MMDASRPSLKKLAAAIVSLLESHLELLALELQEEKQQLVQLLLLLIISIILSLLLLVGLSAALLIAFWSSNPLLATLLLCLLYALLLTTCLMQIKQLTRRSLPFQATREELIRTKEKLLP